MIEKVISGFQSGADIAGIFAARRYGIPTGGWMPRGFRTENGPKPEYAALYGAVEHESRDYPPRTACNVRDSDLTIWFGKEDRAGWQCTMNAIHKLEKYCICIECYNPLIFSENQLADRLKELKPKIINIAGTRGSKMPDRGRWVYEFLCETFRILGFKTIIQELESH